MSFPRPSTYDTAVLRANLHSLPSDVARRPVRPRRRLRLPFAR